MKIKKSMFALFMAVAILAGITIGANGADTLKAVSAYLNYGITIKYNGEEQILKTEKGERIYPITYQGSTYVPIRAVSNILGVGVDWDQATKTVLLGTPAEGIDLIDTLKIYSGTRAEQVQSSAKKSKVVGGITISHWLSLQTDAQYHHEADAYFNLGGKYDTLTFQVYAEKDAKLTISGDNDYVLAEIDLKGAAVPQTIQVELLNTTQLHFHYYSAAEVAYTYIFDANLK